jgi:polyphosphate kinase
MVRVGTLVDYAQFDAEYSDNKTGLTAREQLDEIYRAVAPLYAVHGQTFAAVTEGLARHGVKRVLPAELDEEEEQNLRKHFVHSVMPLLSPQIVDSRHPFPHLANKQIHIAVTLEKKKGPLFGLIAVPSELDRLVPVGNGSGGCFRFILLEDLIYHYADLAFGIYEVTNRNIIAVTRNADIDTEEDLLDEDIDYRQHMRNMLKKRRRLSPVRLELGFPATKELLDFLCEKLHLAAPQVFESSTPLDLSFCFSMDRYLDKETVRRLVWPTHVPAETLSPDKKKNMLKTASGKDMLFSYPFESISPFLELIRQAAEDESVLSIKITLYRIDAQSKLAESLIRAAENGKEVIALMELRARFDEKNNIEWAQRLEEAGCRVIYGLFGYKVHSKICLITRKDYGKLQYITQIGTGNYNEKTARLYTDLALVTSDQRIGTDAAAFFANLLLGNVEGHYSYLWVAPGSLKCNIMAGIEREREKAKAGAGGHIIIKCNSLTDKEIIEALAGASQDGVGIQMIVRGICCLVPQLPGLTEHIRVVSIVGKFLEHSRVFCFGAGAERRLYIASADLMTRNTQRRVEVACPILDQSLSDRIYRMLEVMLKDNTGAWEQHADGRYIPRHQAGTDPAISSQDFFTNEAKVAALSAPAEKYTSNIGKTSFVKRIFRLFRK